MLSTIKLINFRSYPQIAVGFKNLLTVITGHNGAGKTNLLEAISLLAPGRGLRGARLEEVACNGGSRQPATRGGVPAEGAQRTHGEQSKSEWGVIGEIGGYKITTGMETGMSKRIVKIDDEKQRGTNALAEYVSAIWLTPQMDGLFLESASHRRLFFDRIIYNFDPEHAARVAVYENAMRERLKLLKTGSTDKTWLKILERRMAEYGVAVAAARNEVISYLQESLNQSETSFPRPLIDISGKYEALLFETSALEVEDIFAHALLDARYEDAASGRTSNGVHKTDFNVVNLAKNMPAHLCSTGEQKALLLSIILGLARLLKTRKSKTPIILLDEVIAHLDENRRRELFSELDNLECQCFMTGTETMLFKGIKGEFLRVENSMIFRE